MVGGGAYPGAEHALLYSNGQWYDLNDLIDPAASVTLSVAMAINNKGQIVANAQNGHAYLLTPVPEPGTLALSALATVLAMRTRRRMSTSA